MCVLRGMMNEAALSPCTRDIKLAHAPLAQRPEAGVSAFQGVRWSNDTIDNENMDKKKSKSEPWLPCYC